MSGRVSRWSALSVMSTLRLDWCSHKTAEYAVLHWHYSKTMPKGKLVKIGVWEDQRFIGAVIFSRGANRNLLSPFGLNATEGCELSRVALTVHQTPVTRILSIAIGLLRRQSPGLRLIVSYADADQGHQGSIYQGGNWVYDGLMGAGDVAAFIVHGQKTHSKTLYNRYGAMGNRLDWLRQHVDPEAAPFVTHGKHRYLMPLDPSISETIKKRHQPYPKHASVG
jgi:hypothetical protein